MSNNFTNKDLDFWVKNQLNVLFRGERGTGKSTIVIDTFERNNLKWKYFSAATLDPLLDFVGLPEKIIGSDGTKHVEFIPPKDFADEDIEAIFLDEYNRAHKKTKNATMELIQFKSINGRKFPNLKVIWAAVNPEESIDESAKYDVDPMDPAQQDRFHIICDVKYAPDFNYFDKKYGIQVAETAIGWWNEIPKAIQNKVSPRRLDYAVDIALRGGNLQFVLPKESNFAKLQKSLAAGPVLETLRAIADAKDTVRGTEFISDDNNFTACTRYILSGNLAEFYLPLLDTETFAQFIDANKVSRQYVMANPAAFMGHLQILAQGTGPLSKMAQSIIARTSAATNPDPAKWQNLNANPKKFLERLQAAQVTISGGGVTTSDCEKIYRELFDVMPKPNALSQSVIVQFLTILIELLKNSTPATVAIKMPKLVYVLDRYSSTVMTMVDSKVADVVNKKLDTVRGLWAGQ